MSVSGDAKIVEALLDYLSKELINPEIPIAWPNVSFKPNLSIGYLQAEVFQSDVESYALGFDTDNAHTGILQLNLFWPLGKGVIEAMEFASAMADYFKRGTQIGFDGITIGILRAPVVSGALTGEQFLQIPIRIQYTAEIPNN